jgi:RNA polymerase sigma-54 factor
MKLAQFQKLEQRLTPQQIMLSTLLQLPQLRLEQRIKAELEENPILELEDEIEEIRLDQEKEDSDDEGDSVEESPEDALDEMSEEEVDWDEILNDEDSFEYSAPKDPNDEHYEAPVVHHATMAEHLLEQLMVQPLSAIEFDIATYLIYNIREDGYLDPELTTEFVADKFGVEEETVEKILKKIHHLEPLGVGARNLRECLLIQLEEKDSPEAELATRILKESYDDFVNKRFERLTSHFGCSPEEIKEAMNLISTLNPKPGEGITDQSHNYITPDFIVEKVDDEFVITLNEWNIPQLRISNTYKNMLQDKKNKPPRETQKFIRQKIESAKWFINSIQQRRITMMKVMEAIVQKQKMFFEKGPEFLQPMVMKEIAEIIGMDISTVSRVVNGKYVQTSFGVFELRSFFTERMETESGEAVSNQKIKNALKDIINEEDKRKPLSDEALSKELKKRGFSVARRTVTKYREQLEIPVARLRREI